MGSFRIGGIVKHTQNGQFYGYVGFKPYLRGRWEKVNYILNNIIRDKALSIHGFVTYVALSNTLNNNNDIYYVNTEQLCCYIYKDLRHMDIINKGIKNLEDNGYISICEKYQKNNYRIDLSHIKKSNRKMFFTILLENEIDDIFNIDGINIRTKNSIFKYYCILLSSMNRFKDTNEKYRGKVCTFSIKMLSDFSHMSYDTILRYNSILEENNIIYIQRCEDFYLKKNDKSINIKRINNVYSKYSDKDICDDFFAENTFYNNSYKKKSNIMQNGKHSQSMLMKYNYICKGKDYTEGEVKDIYEFILEYNQKQIDLANEQIGKGYTGKCYLNKIKDLKVFNRFDFIRNKVIAFM